MTETTHAGVSPLAVGLLVGGAIWLYRLWRPSRDRNLSRTCYTSALPVSLVWVASIMLFPPGTPKWLGFIILWFPVLVMGVLLLAGAIQGRRDRKADERQRAAWNLDRRRRMLTQAQLTVAWFVGGYVALMALMMVMAVVVVAVSDGRPMSREITRIGAVVGIAFLLVVGVAGWIHVQRRPAKIAREDERLRRLDLGIDDEASDAD